MKRFLLPSSIMLGILACYLGLRGIQWLTGPRPQYPVYPRVHHTRMHPASQSQHHPRPAQLEFSTADSPMKVQMWYRTTLGQDRWTLTQDWPDRLVFQRSWASYELREELTVTLWIQTPQDPLTGTIMYRTEPFFLCGPPALC
jgi:hypothetical protein